MFKTPYITIGNGNVDVTLRNVGPKTVTLGNVGPKTVTGR